MHHKSFATPSLLLNPMLDHFCLIECTKNLFGLDNIVLEWLRSYLTGRIQYVSVDCWYSIAVVMISCVSQDSVLWPLLFSMFTAPVWILINVFGINYLQFADNTQLYTVIDPDFPHCLASLKSCADAVTSWHIKNDLLLNPSKTEALVAGTCQQVAKLDTSNGIVVTNSIGPFSSKLRVLGVTLDEKLTFDDDIRRPNLQNCANL